MENIRITSGKLRGQSIKSPSSKLAHPMGSREKLALFNMLADKVHDAVVLDAFAGSGALGIEAISRGAKSVTFIEKDYKIAHNLISNLEKLGLTDSCEVKVSSVEKADLAQKYDVIITDPPYDKFSIEPILHLTNYIKNGGTLVLSHPTSAPVIPGLELTKTRKYAKAHISIYQKIS